MTPSTTSHAAPAIEVQGSAPSPGSFAPPHSTQPTAAQPPKMSTRVDAARDDAFDLLQHLAVRRHRDDPGVSRPAVRVRREPGVQGRAGRVRDLDRARPSGAAAVRTQPRGRGAAPVVAAAGDAGPSFAADLGTEHHERGQHDREPSPAARASPSHRLPRDPERDRPHGGEQPHRERARELVAEADLDVARRAVERRRPAERRLRPDIGTDATASSGRRPSPPAARSPPALGPNHPPSDGCERPGDVGPQALDRVRRRGTARSRASPCRRAGPRPAASRRCSPRSRGRPTGRARGRPVRGATAPPRPTSDLPARRRTARRRAREARRRARSSPTRSHRGSNRAARRRRRSAAGRCRSPRVPLAVGQRVRGASRRRPCTTPGGIAAGRRERLSVTVGEPDHVVGTPWLADGQHRPRRRDPVRDRRSPTSRPSPRAPAGTARARGRR